MYIYSNIFTYNMAAHMSVCYAHIISFRNRLRSSVSVYNGNFLMNSCAVPYNGL